jgi:hypothetical protein
MNVIPKTILEVTQYADDMVATTSILSVEADINVGTLTKRVLRAYFGAGDRKVDIKYMQGDSIIKEITIVRMS